MNILFKLALLAGIVVALGLMGFQQVAAQQPGITVTRGISPSSVPADGGEVTVTINISGYSGIGSVEETLPEGFSYVDGSVMPSDLTPEVDGRKVTFGLVGETSFSYKVSASGSAGQHRFSGELIYGLDKNTVTVVGDTSLMVEAAQQPGITVTRGISPSSVPADGGEVTVTINISGYSGIGSVEETLPEGFSYVDGSVMPSDLTPEVDGRKVTFGLVGETSFSYKVSASGSAGQHRFSGELIYGLDKNTVTVVGDTSLMVEAAQQPGITVTRGISPSSVPADGGEVTVTINISGYSGIGSVEETLPEGFSYVDGSVMPSDLTPTRAGQKLTFPLVGETSFTYRVMTSASAGTYNFPSGSKLVYGIDRTEVSVGGASRITVGTASRPQPRPQPPAPSPAPSDDTCLETLLVDRVIGEWSSSCGSTDQAGSYARYYSFMLTEESEVTITLESSTDPYLYLRAGDTKSGAYLYENDDVDPGTDTNSEILETLGAGTYTIEATTYSAGETGSFTLTVSGLGGGAVAGPSDDTCLETLLVDRVIGEWSSSCGSTDQAGSYARYYSFMLTEESAVTISLESSTDPYLYLRAGDTKSGAYLYENDDVDPGTDTNSEIEETLGAGIYTIEATTYSAGETGSFTLTVSGLGGGAVAGPSDDTCLVDTVSVDGAVIGEWSSSCGSTDQAGSYARYYSFTLSEGSAVTISLESSTDPYLYLRAGDTKSGAYLYENDDVDPGTDTNSEILETLGAGTYTIEATTYSAGETGSFTLTVSGLGGGAVAGPSDDTCLETLLVDRVIGEWSSSCGSTDQAGSYARYYSFMLTEESAVTISLESSTDPYLYLRAGDTKSGAYLYENDDVDPGTDTNSEIEETLGAGIYTIEATTYSAGETGSFTLTVGGL